MLFWGQMMTLISFWFYLERMDSAPHRTHLVLSLYKRKIVRAFDLLIDHVQTPEPLIWCFFKEVLLCFFLKKNLYYRLTGQTIRKSTKPPANRSQTTVFQPKTEAEFWPVSPAPPISSTVHIRSISNHSKLHPTINRPMQRINVHAPCALLYF
jgi:hypothetical protein